MSKKKFSLGDIIKKLNEAEERSSASSGHDTENRVTPSRLENQSDKIKENENQSSFQGNDLPPQPDYSNPRARKHFEQPQAKRAEKPQEAHSSALHNEESKDKQEQHPVKSIPLSLGGDDKEEDVFDIGKYLAVIFRRKYIILVVAFLVGLHSAYSFLNSSRHYTSRARLLFRPEDRDVFASDHRSWTMFRDREKMFYTHFELLRSNIVLNMASENLQNKVSPTQIRTGLTISRREVEGQRTDIIEMSFRHEDAEMARDVLNELSRTYIDYRRDVDAQEANRLIMRLRSQIENLQTDLQHKEDRLREFKEDNQMAQLSSETNLVVSKLAEMEFALQRTRLDIVESRERLVALQSQISQQDADIVQSMTFQKPFQRKLEELELQLNTLLAQHSPEHFRVRSLMQQIDNIKEAAASEISRQSTSETRVTNPIRQSLLQKYVNITIEKSALETRRNAQEQIIDRLNAELLQLPQIQQTYANLQRDTESTLQTLNLLRTRYEEARIKRDSQEADLSILEYAETPNFSVSDYRINRIFVSVFVGLILGIGLAFLIEYIDQSIKDPAVIERDLEVPLLGIVPFIEADKALVENSDSITKNILEPFRALRANINHLIQANSLKTFMVCSAVKGEGKTTLAANLAVTFAMDGKKVILIDADLRRSQLHNLFSMDKGIGLSEYLCAVRDADEIVKPTKYENLSIITSGQRPNNPAELIGTARFKKLIGELRNRADIVLFDSPALLPVSDSLIMAPKMDCCLFVVRMLWTPLKAAKQAKNQLARIGSKIYGGILNGVSYSKGYYPYYGYYGYYSYKYSYESDAPKPFSLRKIGLKLENFSIRSFKNALYSIPVYLSGTATFLRSLVRKKIFIILIAIFILLLGVNVLQRSRMTSQPEDHIRYIGPAPKLSQ
ncbi:Tyrosine-protein kinase EpsD [Chitinispirillum alkaliphilum]|nr:Tyrosine-protein kinase EpsD [Chitinispirillum alkaliphilum]